MFEFATLDLVEIVKKPLYLVGIKQNRVGQFEVAVKDWRTLEVQEQPERMKIRNAQVWETRLKQVSILDVITLPMSLHRAGDETSLSFWKPFGFFRVRSE